MTWPVMQSRIQGVIDNAAGRVGVCVADIRTRQTLTMGDGGQFITASTNKVAALVELFRQVDAGTVSLSEEVYVTDDDWPSGGSPMRPDLPGTYAVSDLAVRMIHDSDNTATNVIMSRVGRSNIQAMLIGLGLDPVMVGPYSYTRDEPGRQWNADHWEYTMEGYELTGKATAATIVSLLLAIWDGVNLSPASRDQVLSIMRGTKDSSRLRGGLPAGMPLAHKAGSNSGVQVPWEPSWSGWQAAPGISNDAGILSINGFEYAVAILTEGDNPTGSEVIRQISAQIFDGMVGGTATPAITGIYTNNGRTRLV